MGEESGYIRFEEADAAVKARATSVLVDEGGLVVKNSITIVEALTGQFSLSLTHPPPSSPIHCHWYYGMFMMPWCLFR